MARPARGILPFALGFLFDSVCVRQLFLDAVQHKNQALTGIRWNARCVQPLLDGFLLPLQIHASPQSHLAPSW